MFSIILNLISVVFLGLVYSDLSEKGYPLGKRLLIWLGLFLLSEVVIFSIESVFNALPSIFDTMTQVTSQFS